MVIKQIYRVSLWDKDKVMPILTGIHLAPGSAEYEQVSTQPSSSPSKEHCSIGLPMFQPSLPTTLTEMRCSYCQTTFNDRQEQVNHYRLDWHRRNLQLSLQGKSPLTEEQFMSESSDVSSISGSDDDSSEDDDDDEDKDSESRNQVLGKQARLFFLNADGNVISLFRNILFNAKCEMDGEEDVIQRVQAAPRRHTWAIILLGGGHYAAAIFRANEVVIHKTFHNYTVRAKQGGSQSSKDNQSGSAHPKSSGASLRRYNEQSQRQHIQELMESWKTHLTNCDLIFYNAKHHNRSTLFSGKTPILNIQDNRLRKIPFTTKRAKFSEVKRIFGLLSEILVHGTEEEFKAMVKDSISPGEVKPTVKKKKEVSGKKPEKKPKSMRNKSPDNLKSSSSESDSDGDMELLVSLSTLSTSELGGPHCSFKGPLRKKVVEAKKMKGKKKQRNTNTTCSATDTQSRQHKLRVWDVIYTACKTASIERLTTALKMPCADMPEGEALPDDIMESIAHTEIPSNLSAITLGRKERTMLHLAAENGHKDIVWWLLERGCDPSVADTDRVVPYDTSYDKETRNQFRRFMADYPDKYDYKKARVPSPLAPDQEAQQAEKLAQRRKAQRQAKQERQKEKKQKKRELKKEDEEKKQFLELSDREKRALAAERRFLQQQEKVEAPKSCLQRCFMCAADISGIVPFEYSDNKFCSTKCVREHRIKKPQ
ncbi:ankyrin repeat and zinc finger domain-containing protein 1-like isoform X2 [Homarus americanus]|nr:ankyrin repeat and zinc finger domain-containing protein 1-like isoform X2 [Homarus americanus]XP_042206877.1 ankyrin repeat and zinc finger domain-containing protein 1-like isoform X2 [Homarus americanus]XP_042206878.1 ankyrin repeat and zinc finger domain-containing protein 1-like isoform X2 [Homarus americanus]